VNLQQIERTVTSLRRLKRGQPGAACAQGSTPVCSAHIDRQRMSPIFQNSESVIVGGGPTGNRTEGGRVVLIRLGGRFSKGAGTDSRAPVHRLTTGVVVLRRTLGPSVVGAVGGRTFNSCSSTLPRASSAISSRTIRNSGMRGLCAEKPLAFAPRGRQQLSSLAARLEVSLKGLFMGRWTGGARVEPAPFGNTSAFSAS